MKHDNYQLYHDEKPLVKPPRVAQMPLMPGDRASRWRRDVALDLLNRAGLPEWVRRRILDEFAPVGPAA